MREWKTKLICEWMNDWLTDWMNEWMNEWTNERMNEWINAWMKHKINVWMNEWLTECVNAWMTEWLNDWLIAWLIDWLIDWLYGRVDAPQLGEFDIHLPRAVADVDANSTVAQRWRNGDRRHQQHDDACHSAWPCGRGHSWPWDEVMWIQCRL